MEPRFGADFSSVRVHTGSEAVQMNRELGAQAFAHGSDVYFGAGKSPGNNELTAHELTHVVQQTGGVQKRLLSNPPTVQQKCSNCEDDQVRLKESSEAVMSEQATPLDLAITSTSTSTIQRADGPCKDAPPRIPHHLIIRGSVHPDVREAQRKLNQYHRQEQAAGRPGLPDAPLVEDCIFGSKTYNATLAFQQRVFPAQPEEHDGKIGDHTWAELDRVSGTPIPPTPTPPTPTPPTPTPPRVIPCTPLPRQIFSRGGCGAGTDFTHNDFPSLAGVSSYGRTLVWQADHLSTDFRLRNDMRTELGVLAGSEGLRMVSHFSGGTGTRLTHDPTSTLGRDALSSGTFSHLNRSVIREIEHQLAGMTASGVIDCNTITLPPGVPAVSFTFADGYALKGIIGGTQGLVIRITNFSVNPGSRSYDIGLQYLICDDFGVDTADLYSPGLAAFWVLQHRRSGYVPFINELDLPMTAIGTY
jgi:peptidoglycan hydrolase-like protein with peptidoglycan-binding domain